MLTNPTMAHLKDLRLPGMLEAYTRQMELPEYASLTFEERFSLIVDYEWARRRTNKINPGFPEHITMESVTFQSLVSPAKV